MRPRIDKEIEHLLRPLTADERRRSKEAFERAVRGALGPQQLEHWIAFTRSSLTMAELVMQDARHRHLVEEQSEAAFALGLLGIDAKESGA